MRPYFIWKGQDSRDMGILVVSLPPIVQAGKRVEITEIEGKDGDLVQENGDQAYDQILKIGLKDPKAIDYIAPWLCGAGNLILSSEPDKYRKAQIWQQIDYQRLVRFRVADLVFHFQPGKYKNKESPVIWESGEGLAVRNSGNRESLPEIQLSGSGTIHFYVNGSEIFKIDLTEGETVTVDSEIEEAYAGNLSTLRNRQMTGGFPVLQPGENKVTWTGTLTALSVRPRSRWYG